jgi:hypothetical protein
MRMLPSSLLISLLVVEVEAKSLNEAMAKIKKDAGFDPKEPPEHKTDIRVGLYIEHLLDVSAIFTLHNPPQPSTPSTPSTPPSHPPASTPSAAPLRAHPRYHSAWHVHVHAHLSPPSTRAG